MIFFLGLIVAAIPVIADSDANEYATKTIAILNDLNSLVSKTKTGNENVKSAIMLSMDKIRKGEMLINIDPSLPKDVFSGIQFSSPASMDDIDKFKPSIQISPYVIDLYQTNPSIVLSALAHEMQHASSFFNDKQYFTDMINVDLENYRFEMDAYNIEANFIIAYLLPNKYTLTTFETVLYKSFQEDYLSNFSFALLGRDMEMAFALSKIHDKFDTYEACIGEINKMTTDLLNTKFDKGGKDWENYKKIVPIISFLKFAPQAIRNIDTKFNKIPDQKAYTLEKCQPELYKHLIELSKIYLANQKYFDDFFKKTRSTLVKL